MAGIISSQVASVIAHPYSAIWISCCDRKFQAIIARVSSVRMHGDNKACCFIPERYSREFSAAASEGKPVAVIAASIENFESYQLKGKFISMRDVTDEEAARQTESLRVFSKGMKMINLSFEKSLNAYSDGKYLAVTLQIESVYEQTPKMGTGNKISS